MEKSHLSESYGTLYETTNALVKNGYSHDFNIKGDCLVCNQADMNLSPDDFQIDKVYRFEGASNPDDQSIVYAISSDKFGIKGILVNGYGIYADDMSAALVQKLGTHPGPRSEIKANESTPQRPEGDRIIDAPMVETDLNIFIKNIKLESTWAESGHNSIVIFKSDALRIVLMGIHKNAEIKSHSAKGFISIQVLEGKINFITENKVTALEKGQMIALHPEIIHSVQGLEESFFLLTLSMNKK